MQLNKKYFYTGLILLLVATIIQRYFCYFQTSYPNGWDAYFYLDQIKHYNNTGHLHTPRTSLFYPVLNGFYYFTGSYELAYKWCLIICSTAFVFAACYLSYFLSLKDRLNTLLIGYYFMCSPVLVYFGSQYGKNLLGMVFLLFFMAFLIQKRTIPSIAFFLLSLFSHKLTGGVALLFGITYLSVLYLPKLSIKKIMVSAIILITLLTSLIFLFQDQLSRQQEYFNGFTLPWFSFIYEMDTFFPTILKFEVILQFTLVVSAIFIIFLKPKRPQVVLLLVLGILCFPFLKWDTLGYSYRFFLTSLLLSPHILVVIGIKKRWINFVLIVMAGMVSLFSWKAYNPHQQDPPYPLYEHIASQLPTNDSTLIIAHKGLAEFISFKTGTEVMPWIPEYSVPIDKLYRIVYLPSIYSETVLPKGRKLTLNYYYIKEITWQKFLNRLKKEDISLLKELATWKNPLEVRPAYLTN